MPLPRLMTRLGLLLALSAAQIPASAQTDPLNAAKAACGADLQQFCAGVQPGGGRMLACLKEHRVQISAGCKQAVRSVLQGASGGTAPDTGQPIVGGPAAPVSVTPPPAPAAASPAATTQPASTPAPKPSSAHGGSGAARYFELKRLSTTTTITNPGQPDHVVKVYSLLAPADWKLVGGAHSNPNTGSCFSDLNLADGVVKTSDGAYGMLLMPQSTFRYVDDPAIRRQMEQRDRFDEKFKLKGCPIVAPMHAAEYIRDYVVWKFHTDKPPIASEPFPELEQLVRAQLGLGPKGAGAGTTRVEAVRVRLSTTSTPDTPVDEWWAAAIVVHTVPTGGRGMGYDWHAEQITGFQAPRGKLDGYDKLYRVMATSVRFDPQYLSMTSAMKQQVYTAWAREMQKQNAIVAAFQQHVIETIQGVTANQQRGSMVAAYGADQLVRGVQTFRDPSTGRTVELSNLYDHAWSNGSDGYIVTDDANYNPNGRANGSWGELQLVRPQP